MTTPEIRDAVAILPVTQEDREAAAGVSYAGSFVAHIRDGMEDDGELVQAFARHRLQSTPADPKVSREAVEQAARYVLDNSRRGNKASINDEQFDADTDKLMAAYRDIITKAVASGFLALSNPPADGMIVARPHEMVPGGFGHGLSHCKNCKATDREIAFALGPTCHAPPSAPLGAGGSEE